MYLALQLNSINWANRIGIMSFAASICYIIYLIAFLTVYAKVVAQS